MPVERLRQSFDFNRGHRYFFLYGRQVDDVFISEQYEELSLELALWRLLRERGFERIAFFSGIARGIYFFDNESLNRSRPRPPTAHGGDRIRPVGRGPLGDRLLKPAEAAPDHEEGASQSGSGRMGDTHAFGRLHDLMGQPSPRTAVVFMQVENLLHLSESRRQQAGRIAEWGSLPFDNDNVCLFVFKSHRLSDLSRKIEQLGIPDLRNHIPEDGRVAGNVIKIPKPSEEEIVRVLDIVRLRYRLLIEWRAHERMIATLARADQGAREWLSQLKAVVARGGNRLDVRMLRELLPDADPRDPMDRLNEMIGLESVKRHIAAFRDYMAGEIERQGLDAVRASIPSLHLVFTGNPGTGKTTVAHLIGEIYHELKLLSRGHTVKIADMNELQGEFVGQTPARTSERINEALDGVLFIDEAYQLTDDVSFGQQVVDTLVKRMEDERGRLAVIVAGYPEQMEGLLKANPGLKSRFPPQNFIHFEDYTPDELLQILHQCLWSHKRTIAAEDLPVFQEVIEGMWYTRDKEFGNAREMRSFAENLARDCGVRANRAGLCDEPVRAADISQKMLQHRRPPVPTINALLGELDAMVGLHQVKQFIRQELARLQISELRRERGQAQVQPTMHMLFLGNPGTGKTTVARLMGQIFRSLRILRKGHLVEATRADLVAEYVGQTTVRLRAKVTEAIDGVLFLDEAYSLLQGGPNDFGREALEELMTCMENHRGRLVVIFAGYPQEMEGFLNANPGLPRRIPHRVFFEDYSDAELGAILVALATERSRTFTHEALGLAVAYLAAERIRLGRAFGNAGSARILFDRIDGTQCLRLSLLSSHIDDVTLNRIEAEDVPHYS